MTYYLYSARYGFGNLRKIHSESRSIYGRVSNLMRIKSAQYSGGSSKTTRQLKHYQSTDNSMAFLILISAVTTFSALGQPHTNYVTSVERMSYADCVKVKNAVTKQHHTATCVKEGK